jgi:hypothetical protein
VVLDTFTSAKSNCTKADNGLGSCYRRKDVLLRTHPEPWYPPFFSVSRTGVTNARSLRTSTRAVNIGRV